MTRRRLAFAVLSGALLGVGTVGALHHPAARGALRRWGGRVCPVAPLDPVAREAGRRRAVAGLAGDAVAPAKPALGFVLGATVEGEVRAWIASTRAACEDARGGSTITCVGVPSSALPSASPGAALSRVSFRFDPASRLVAIVAVRDGLSAAFALETWERSREDLARALGAPSSSAGQRSAAWLDGGDLRQLRLEHRFVDYYAAVAATRVGRAGVAVTEEYQLLVDPAEG